MAGRGGSRIGSGRPRGSLNKETIEKAIIAERITAAVEMRGEKLAKEYLNEFLKVFAGMAAHFQPTHPGMPVQNPNANEAKFEKWARLTIDTATQLAKYQSPQFRAVMVAPAPETDGSTKRKRFSLTIFEGGKPVSTVEVEPKKAAGR
jgi:hypothetical protein